MALVLRHEWLIQRGDERFAAYWMECQNQPMLHTFHLVYNEYDLPQDTCQCARPCLLLQKDNVVMKSYRYLFRQSIVKNVQHVDEEISPILQI